MTWNPAEHSDHDNLQWCWLRAVEWGRWPIFLSQPLAPALLILFSWQAVVAGVIVANLLWAFFIRYRFVSVGAADAGVLFVLLKWLSWPLSTFYLFHVGRKPEGWVALAWPVLIFVIGAFPTTQVGRIQVRFMQALVPVTLTEAAPTATAEPRARRGRAPRIEPYGLGMSTEDVSGLVELSADERRALNPGIEFQNERICHAPPGTFAGVEWKVTLGAVDGKVYKISAIASTENREARDQVGSKVTAALLGALGAFATSQPQLWIWDTEDGNVVLNFADAWGQHFTVVTITSGEVSGFVRVK